MKKLVGILALLGALAILISLFNLVATALFNLIKNGCAYERTESGTCLTALGVAPLPAVILLVGSIVFTAVFLILYDIAVAHSRKKKRSVHK